MNFARRAALAAGLILSLRSPAAAEIKKYKIALLRVSESAGETFQSSNTIRRQIGNLQEPCEKILRAFLAKEGRFLVPGAEEIEAALPELDPYGGPGLSPFEAAKAAKALGVDYILVADENVVFKQFTGGGSGSTFSTGNVALTLRVLKGADGTEIFSKTHPWETNGPLLTEVPSHGANFNLRVVAGYALGRALSSFQKEFGKVFPEQDAAGPAKGAKP